MKRDSVIALDADGVCIDYHKAYAQVWGKAFGEQPEVVNPLAYYPKDRYGLPTLDGEKLEHFRRFFNEEFWSTIPALPGAVEACHALRAAGYDLICVSAIQEEYRGARHKNLLALGFPIQEVIASPNREQLESPKAQALTRLMPEAFVDDYLPYLRGVPASIHCALIDRSPQGSPNEGPELNLAQSVHKNLLDFSKYWLSRI